MGINVGSQSGVSFNASASRASGNADGSDVTWTNTHLSAGNTLTVQSGGDLNLRGAVIAANTVKGEVGGNLNVESLQDTSTYASKQTSSGGGVSLCIPPLCYGSSSVSVNVGKANVQGDFASVTEQSGIKAGDGGFQLNVTGNTDLKGGVLASTAAAIQNGKNSLATATLTQSDIQNRDNYSASGYSIGATFSGALGDQESATTDAQKDAAKSALNAKPAGSAGIGSASGSQGSTTASGISAGVLTITDGAKQQELTGASAAETVAATNRAVTTGQDASAAITKVWNGTELMTDVQAQVQITAAFGPAAMSAWGKYANDQLLHATTQEEAECWGPTGACRAGGHAVIGALGGGAAGAVGAATASASVTHIGAAIQSLGLTDAATQGLTQAIVLGAAGAAGGVAAAAGAYNEASNNSLALLMRLTQLGTQVAQQGIGAVSAEGQILLTQCARTACSAILPTAVILALTSKVATTGPSLVDQIPTDGYQVIRPDAGGGTTVSPASAPGGSNSTTTPGTAVTSAGTPSYGSGRPVTGSNTTVTPAGVADIGSTIVMSERIPPSILGPDGRLPPGIGGIGTPIPMPTSSNPNQTAEEFARNAFNGQTPDSVQTGVAGPGSWLAKLPDGTIVLYRPAGEATRTSADTASVDINGAGVRSINNGRPAKFKFPGD